MRNENSAVKTVEADLIVGCDGIHSNVRKQVTAVSKNEESLPRWTGITMLRGLTRMKHYLDGRTMLIIGPIHNEMVIYPISKEVEDEDTGEALVNWVALMRTANDKDDRVMPEKWNNEVRDIEKAMEPFKNFKYDFIDVPEMIRSAEKVYQYPMIDRE